MKLDGTGGNILQQRNFPLSFVFMFIVTLHGDLHNVKVNPNVLLLLCTSIPPPPLYQSCTGLVVEGACGYCHYLLIQAVQARKCTILKVDSLNC